MWRVLDHCESVSCGCLQCHLFLNVCHPSGVGWVDRAYAFDGYFLHIICLYLYIAIALSYLYIYSLFISICIVCLYLSKVFVLGLSIYLYLSKLFLHEYMHHLFFCVQNSICR